MNPENKKISSLAILLLLSPIALLLAYGNYDLFRYNTQLFMETFNKWPWIRVSIILTIVTSLSANVLAKDLKKDIWFQSAFYSFIILSGMLFLLYPGLQELELQSDPNFFIAVFNLTIVHTIGFKLIIDARKKELSTE